MLAFQLLVVLASLVLCVPMDTNAGGSAPASPNVLSRYSIALPHIKFPPHHPMAHKRSRMRTLGSEGDSNLLSSIATGGYGVLAKIKLGNEQTFLLLIDTASSDMWVAGNNFVSEGTNQHEIDQAGCKFGATFTKSSDFTPLPDVILNVAYGGGVVHVTGGLGTDSITVGDVTVANQSIAVLDAAIWVSREYSKLAWLMSILAGRQLHQ
jgi:hypothetical protein